MTHFDRAPGCPDEVALGVDPHAFFRDHRRLSPPEGGFPFVHTLLVRALRRR